MNKEMTEVVLVSKDELQRLIINSVNACLKYYTPKSSNLPISEWTDERLLLWANHIAINVDFSTKTGEERAFSEAIFEEIDNRMLIISKSM